MTLDWMDSALCAQVDPDLWFPNQGGVAREAKDVCRRCPVRVECAEYGADELGVWGGTSPADRLKAARAA